MAGFCPNCGFAIDNGNSFCMKCGAAVSQPSGQTQAAYQAQPVYEAQPVGQTQAAYQAQPVGRTQAAYQAQPVYQAQPAYQAQPVYQNQADTQINYNISINEYFKKYALKSNKVLFIIGCVVCGLMMLYFSVLGFGVSPINLLHVALYIAALITMLVNKNFICPLVVAGIETVCYLISFFLPIGGSIPFGLILACISLARVNASYKEFKATGNIN